jgi:hypothetical protein
MIAGVFALKIILNAEHPNRRFSPLIGENRSIP